MLGLLFLFFFSSVTCDRVVQTTSGPVRGIPLDTKNVEAFLGIPYAEPPVGNLRFARPIPKSPWTEIFDARELPPTCIQSMINFTSQMLNQSFEVDEDCLYLNLWVPETDSTQRAVMVFIHGGGFMTGSSNIKIYDGAALSQHGDVIVASMNYRVGTLGFFSAFIDEAAGSMGMYDQLLALQWIKDNAKYFGGDPDNIVIFGESAGAFSVSLHIVSPLSKNLFNRAVLQSGTAFHPMYSNNNEVLRMNSQKISKLLGCADNDEDLNKSPENVVKCMKSLPSEKFPEADEVLFKKYGLLIPRVGDEFLPVSPTDLFRKGEFKESEVLLGVNRDEGSTFVTMQLSLKDMDIYGTFGNLVDENNFNETMAEEIVKPFILNEQFNNIIQNYFKRVKEESRYSYLNAVSDIVGDNQITCSVVFQADFQSLKSYSVYFYLFDYRSPSSPFPKWVGVPHFEEVPYVFGNPLWKPFSESEEELSKDIMDMWIAFAKTGNPSIPGGLKWPTYTYEDPKYLIIGLRDKIGVKPDDYRCEAWRSVFRSKVDEEVVKNLKK